MLGVVAQRGLALDHDQRANALRRRMGEDVSSETGAEVEAEETENAVELSDERFAAMQVAEQIILTVSENGYGKRTPLEDYRLTARGRKGVTNMKTTPKIGKVIGILSVKEDSELMIITKGGQIIRIDSKEIRQAGRSTQGVNVFTTSEGERVVSVERISDEGLGENETGEGPEDLGPSDSE